MNLDRTLRILEVGHDPWIAPCYEADFLAIGGSLRPGNSARPMPWAVTSKIIWRIISGSYDVIALPPMHVRRLIGLGHKARLAKKLFGLLAGSDFLGRIVRRLMSRRKTMIVVFDIDDAVKVSDEVCRIFQPQIYFKRNLLRKDLLRDPLLLRHLPMGIGECGPSNSGVTADLFVCGEYSTEARRTTLEAARRLRSLGWRVDIVETRIAYSEYRRRLAQAKAAFCFQGIGFHTWRMYEAACSGTIPIIDRPESDVIHDFIDSENCIIVAPSFDEIVLSVDELLRSPQKLSRISAGAYRLAESKYTRRACARYLIEEIAGRFTLFR